MGISRTCSSFSVSFIFFHCVVLAGGLASISTDHSALLALKSHISFGPNNDLEKNWSADSSVCWWVGVICGQLHHRVVALDISDLRLSGRIPPHLGNLSFLRSLDISRNFFNGNLPEELGKLHRLKWLDLSGNNFSGMVPTFFSSLPNLQFLYLSNNQFSGRIPSSISNISRLNELTLYLNFLQGTIPEGIGDLHSLTLLELEDNLLTGSIPSSIFNISSLENIGLSRNKLSGKLPGDICHNLPKLQGLYLSRNNLDGLIPPSLHKCSQLQVLLLSYNKFSGTIPREIGNLTMLIALLLGFNNLEGSIPMKIGNLRRLEDIGFDYNGLSGSIPATIFNISALRIFSADGNRLSGKLPPHIGQGLPNLEELYLYTNNLSGNVLDAISNCSKLNKLELSHNSFTGPIPNSLGNLRSLSFLNLGFNNFTIEPSSSELKFLTSLTNCVNLTHLDISENPLNGNLPSSIGNFSASLQRFLAYKSTIRGNIPEEIGNLSKISKLFLSCNEFGGIPRTFEGLQNLQELHLAYNKISGSFPSIFCNLQNLGLLDLSGNRISGSLPSCIGNITTLRNIYLDSNNFSSSLPSSLWLLKDLLEVHVSSNSLSGHLPPEIGGLKVITLIDLSMNNFSGNIPLVDGLQSLIELSLAHNELEGPIPHSLGRVLNLEILDLSFNRLTGLIPQSLEALLYLKKFNVSFNQLSGEIPRKGPFLNFTGQSFMFNGALCGGSQFNVPPCRTFSPHRRKRLLVIVYALLGISSLILLAVIGVVLTKRHKRKQTTLESGPPAALEHERISYHELRRATNGFSQSNLLGKGSHGFVYEGIFSDGTRAAVKVFDLNVTGALKSFDRECDVLRNIRHRNLTKVETSCSTPDFKALLLEYMPNGSLEKWLYSHNYFLDIFRRLNIMIDVASAIDYLHNGYSMVVVHCDLKPSNVLLDEDMVAHVSDFGIAKLLGVEDSITQTKTLATIGYIAPEYGREGLVSTKCDIYSFGIMLMETFTRKKPNDDMFSGDMSLRNWIKCSLPNAIVHVADSNFLKPEEHSFDAKAQCLVSVMEIALECTAELPDSRINIKDVLVGLQKIRLQFVKSNIETS